MTPLALEMLIWFCTRAPEAGPFENIRLGPQSEIVEWFLRDGIVTQEPVPLLVYRATDKGHAWLSLILATPMPKQVWVDPREAA